MYETIHLYDLSKTQAGEYLSAFTFPWEALGGLQAWLTAFGKTLPKEYVEQAPGVWVHKTAVVAKTACVCAPCIIGENSEVRHCAFIRGGVLVGKNCVVGNSTEVKNAVLFDGVQVPHYNYVGDSILGYKAHLGAGAVTSNVKADKTPVFVRDGDERIATDRKKVGAFLGDFAEIGCNSVLNPGTVIGRGATVYPLSCVRGIVKENSIYKNNGEVVEKYHG